MGFGQLSLAEHSLCPLDSRSSLVRNLVHETEFRYSDSRRKRRTAQVRVSCPNGLSASDEFYLWGLLALTMSQPGDRADLVATPHWCLKQLGVVNSGSGRGTEHYRLFRDALRRLSAVHYHCDAFYDPARGEHREVAFHFFSMTLPVDPVSSRAWCLNWDRTFLDLTKHGSSHLRFDLELYRKLDPATRRLFLFISKIFHRREHLPQFALKHLANDVLGYARTVSPRDLRIKVLRCLKRLEAADVVRNTGVTRVGRNHYVVNACRGRHFDRRRETVSNDRDLQPVLETLLSLGFKVGAATGLIRRYPVRLVEQWADITQAKLEHHGRKSFRKSPAAYLVNNVSMASKGRRTPPDWYHTTKRTENADLSVESHKLLNQIRTDLFPVADESRTTKQSSTDVQHITDIFKDSG